ncbi:MAG: hypothetical protein ACAH59_11875, partial [Pseudobdellovibrionaceae bacterium]
MKISYEERLHDREAMPGYDESILFPEIERRKLGINDEDMKYLVEYFRWQLEQRSRRRNHQRIIAILKLRMEKLIHQKQSELSRELEV